MEKLWHTKEEIPTFGKQCLVRQGYFTLMCKWYGYSFVEPSGKHCPMSAVDSWAYLDDIYKIN